MRKTSFLFLFVFINNALLFSKPLDLEVFAESAILINADNSRVLFQKNADSLKFPASITKIATGLYVLDQKPELLDEYITASSDALRMISPRDKALNGYEKYPCYCLETDGTSFGIKKGEILSFKALFYGMMLSSGNDAANVIAEGVDGTIPCFVENLNKYLLEIGCKNTHFLNPHGLHHPNHVTTAIDMAKIAQKALNNSFFRDVVSSLSYTRPKSNKQEAKTVVQRNRLIKKGSYYYPYAIGLKTGFHSLAKNTLVAAAEKEGRTLIAVLLGCEHREDRYIDAKKLFEAAFNEELQSRLVLNKKNIFKTEVEGGCNCLKASLVEDLFYEAYPSEEMDFKIFIHWNELDLPIIKGEKVGVICLETQAGEILKEVSVVAVDEVKKSFWFSVKHLFRKRKN